MANHSGLQNVTVAIKDNFYSCYLYYDTGLGGVEQVGHLKQVVVMLIHLSLLYFYAFAIHRCNLPRGGSDGFDDVFPYKIKYPDYYMKNYCFVKIDYEYLCSNNFFCS